MKKPKHAPARPAAAETLSERPLEAEIPRLVHDLQVHQIELAMQNDELTRARQELETALRQYTDLYDFAPVGYFTLARDGAIQQVNLAGARLLGVERARLAQRRLGVFVAAGSRAIFSTFLDDVFTHRQNEACELELLKDAAQPFWAHMEASLLGTEAEPGETCRAVVVDISAARQAQEALRQSEAHFRGLAQALPDAIFTLELPSQKVSYFNHEVFLGYRCAELMADISLLGARHPEDAPAFLTNWQRVLAGETPAQMEYRVRTRAGDWEWVQSRAVVQLRDAYGAPSQILIVLSTITERRQAGEALRHMSAHDALTGLYNRSFFEEELLRLERGRRFPISLVIADVDQLKATNDQWGHAAGDALLKRVAQVLTLAFRGEDVVTRIGGDEFAVLLPDTDAVAAEHSLRRVRQVIQESNAAHTGTPIRLSLGASTAVSPGPLAGALNEADANMYQQKRGRDAA